MNCATFDRWLDDGRPAADLGPAAAHARGCARCAGALDAALELEAALAVTAPAPAGFTDRVMARVAATAQEHPIAAPIAAAPLLGSPFAWWVRVTMEPSVLLAALLLALLVGFGAPIFAGAGVAGSWLAGLGARFELPRLGGSVWPVVTLALGPAFAWSGWMIYRWSEALASRGATIGRGSRSS